MTRLDPEVRAIEQLARTYRIVDDDDLEAALGCSLPPHVRAAAFREARERGLIHCRTAGRGYVSLRYAGCLDAFDDE